jgi:hypothetical protein
MLPVSGIKPGRGVVLTKARMSLRLQFDAAAVSAIAAPQRRRRRQPVACAEFEAGLLAGVVVGRLIVTVERVTKLGIQVNAQRQVC